MCNVCSDGDIRDRKDTGGMVSWLKLSFLAFFNICPAKVFAEEWKRPLLTGVVNKEHFAGEQALELFGPPYEYTSILVKYTGQQICPKIDLKELH